MYVQKRAAHASPRVQELGHKIEAVIREYRQTQPGLDAVEIQQALKLAETNTGAAGKRAQVAAGVVAALTGAAVLGGIFFWQQAESSPAGSETTMLIPYVAVALVGLALVAVAMRRRG